MYKQREIAKILNCSQRVYSNYERGDLDIPTEILIKLAKHYDVSTDYILGISDKMKPNK
ncbi:MAG: helix-turn-helix domain-containing protein [Eubacterium sp.]|uniref:helix-turn-helix domain-containing protein n=1 Tax=Eubacterium sp. TaxID=142586 RepID=UPI0015A9D1A0|nr:helix-turn-helix transcriptional regulator [Clostridiales bacterium]MEE0175154.1 helix-turn-helix transcriptional regulator [Eubacterium sp.]